MQFELLRLSLLARAQIDAFEERDPTGKPLTREQWLRSVFARRITFEHRRETFHYVPQPKLHEVIVAGRVGRQISVQEHEPPEAGLVETERELWRAAALLIDPRHHDDGQKVAFEHDPRVGQPIALMESLASHINVKDPPSPYVLEINPISDAADFWAFVQANRGEITSVTFELVAPNMFGMEDDYEKEMRDIRDKERARRLKIQLVNSDGLELETPRVEGAVGYATRGGGSIRAQTKHHRKFNSKSRARRVGIPDKVGAPSPVDVLLSAIAAIFER